MRLAKLVEKYIADQEWYKEQIQADVNAGKAKFGTNLSISNQSFRLLIESNDESESLILNLCTPFCVIESKLPDAFLLLNYLNDQKIYRGRLIVNENGNVCFKDSIDMQNIEGNIALIDTMLQSGIRVFDDNMDAIASVALTRKTYKSIRKEYDNHFDIENPPHATNSLRSYSGEICVDSLIMFCTLVLLEGVGYSQDEAQARLEGLKKIKDALDNCRMSDETEGLRLQMAMDRMSKMMQALSNIEKKISDVSQTIIENMK